MLTQRKRKRTVEDFNQFCTFVLAYAGYIPYPTEEQQCKDNTLSSRNLCSTESSEGQACLVPPATQPVRSVETEDRARPRRGCRENRKRRNKEMSSAGMVEGNPHSRIGDFVAGKKSSRNKETPKNGSLNEVQFGLKNGPIVYSSVCADGANSVIHAIEHPSPEVLSLSPKQCGPSDTEIDGLPVLKQEPEMESCDPYCDQSKQEPVDRAGHEEPKKEGKVYPLCAGNKTAACHCHDLSDKGAGDGLEVEEEPMDLTLTVQAERLEGNPVQGGQGREGAVREEGGVWAKEEKEEVEAWERDTVGGADVLRMVMERQAGAEQPEDQDAGYHTDWNGSTPDRAGSDTDPEFRPTHKDATASSGYSTEGLNSETSHMEDDDSWDLITCFCLKPFAGRPMIECSECNTWVHLSCAKIRRTHVPDVFVCASCRSSKQNIRRSGRARVAPRKRFSD